MVSVPCCRLSRFGGGAASSRASSEADRAQADSGNKDKQQWLERQVADLQVRGLEHVLRLLCASFCSCLSLAFCLSLASCASVLSVCLSVCLTLSAILSLAVPLFFVFIVFKSRPKVCVCDVSVR